jgi:hypothetical protein
MSSAAAARPPLRRRQLAVRLLSNLVLVALLVGVPFLLVQMHAIPPFTELRNLLIHPTQAQGDLTNRISDSATTKIVWSVAWLIWAWFVICVGVEITGRIRGRTAGRVPGSRHIQSLVTYLVGASLAFALPARPVPPLRLQVAVLSAPNPYRQSHGAEPQEVNGDQSATPVESQEGPSTTALAALETPPRIYVVQPRDTLWAISEAELGSPLGWRRIAAANYGRPQPDGGTLTNAHWIRPGWRLVIPTDGSGQATAAQARASSFTSPTEGTAPPMSVAPVPKSGVMTTSAPGTVEFTNGSRSKAARSEGGLTTSRDLDKDKDKDRDRDHVSPGHHIPVAPIGYGLLGAGIVGLLDRMRRAQQRLRPTGLRIALPEGDLVELERGLRLGADPGSADWVDLTLRILSVAVRRDRLAMPEVSAVLLRDDAVEIVLDPTSQLFPPPSPFELGLSENRWVLAKSGQRIEELRKDSEVIGIDAPLPALVTLGRDTRGVLMVNIERAGSVAVTGPETDPLVQAIAVELATAPWSDQIDLVLVGFGVGNDGLERVSHAASLLTVSAKMRRRVRERATLLALADRATNSETRWLDGGDAWDLCVVVCSPEASADEPGELEHLIEVVGDGSLGVALICGCDVLSARWRVRAEVHGVSVGGESLEWSSLSRQPVPPNLVEGVAALVSVAAQTDGVTPDDGPYGSLSLRIPERAPGPDGFDSDLRRDPRSDTRPVSGQPTVLVRVLGRVEITGAARQFTRAWAIELIVYLAVHPAGVSNERWATALWPDKEMAPASLHSTASAARRSLGVSASGEDHLPRSRGRLALGPEVRTDWDVFVGLSQSPSPSDWRDALGLIGGRPFDGLRSPDWVVLEGILATVEAGVVDLATRYAEHCLENIDPPGADWAARQGLRVSPYDERLYRVLMRASDVAGNPAGIESVMAELVRLVADDVEPFDAVHPETLALYRKLSRRSFISPRP